MTSHRVHATDPITPMNLPRRRTRATDPRRCLRGRRVERSPPRDWWATGSGDLCRTSSDAAVLPRRERHRRLVAGVGAGRTHRGDGDARRRARCARGRRLPETRRRRRGRRRRKKSRRRRRVRDVRVGRCVVFAGSPPVLEDDAYARSANDDDGATVHAEEEGIHDERGDRDGDDEDLEDLLTESEYAGRHEDAGDPFAASYRRDRSRFRRARRHVGVFVLVGVGDGGVGEDAERALRVSVWFPTRERVPKRRTLRLRKRRDAVTAPRTRRDRNRRRVFPRATEPDETRVARLRASPGRRLVPRLV